MYPGLSEADFQVAAFRYRQLVTEGQRQQLVAGVQPGSADTLRASIKFQPSFGTRLVHAGHRLLGLHSITTQSLDTVATGKRAAIA